MNIALIFAGGTGQRMNTRATPKQFLQLYGKPIIIYTLEQFSSHPEIDGIGIVCLEGWQDYLTSLLQKFRIEKVAFIVPGGRTGQESIFHGVQKSTEIYPDDTIVLVHDGVRPMIDAETIHENICCVQKHGSAITVSPAVETVTIRGEDSLQVGHIIDRKECQMAKAPQSFYLGDLYRAHLRAQELGQADFIDSACLMQSAGHTLYTVTGSDCNIKITTPTDFYIFRALMDAKENEQIMGN